jgi:hypothetical protein
MATAIGVAWLLTNSINGYHFPINFVMKTRSLFYFHGFQFPRSQS